jgi:hypothetical protein
MIISVDVDHPISNKNVLVQVETVDNNAILDLSKHTKTLTLEFNLPICNQTVELRFCCDDLQIVDYPLTITNIVLDNFYQSPSILYRGQPKFDQQFLSFAMQKNMYLDLTVNDSNKLDFTGQLVYKFAWPFYKNLVNLNFK